MPEPLFCAMPAATLRIEALDTLTLVYHRSSGITHLLASPAPEILAMLADGPMTRAALLARLDADFSVVDSDEALLSARLAELVASGLVAVT